MLHTTNYWVKSGILASLFLFFSLGLGAQNLMNHVPKGALFVAQMHLDKLDTKADLDSVGAMGFVKDLTRRAPDFVKNPAKFGVDLRKKVVMYYTMGEDLNYFAMMIPLKESSKMKGLGEVSEGKWSVVPTQNFYTIREKRASFQEESFKTVGAYNESFLMLFNDMTPPSYDYDPDLSWEEREEKRRESKKLKQIAVDAQIANLMGMTGINSITTDADFQARFSRKGDANIWVSSAVGMSSYQRILRKNPLMKGFYNQLEDLAKGSYYTGSLDMDVGKMVLDFETHSTPRMMEMAKEISKAKINKKFAQYVPQENLIGYMAYAFNSYNLGETYREYLTPLLDSFPQMPSGLGTGIYDVIDIFIDQEAISELIPGNMMFALTGVKNLEQEYTTYEYNDSTYERVEVIKTKTETIPEFVFMLTTEREDDMKKILDLMAKIPMKRNKQVMVNQGFYYSIPEVKKKTGMDLMFAVRDGILFISNNNDLIQNKLGSGYASGQGLASVHRKALKKSNQVVYMNFEKLFATLKTIPGRSFQGEQPQKALDIMAANMGEVWSRNYKRSDPFHSYLSISMKDEDTNSLDQMANMVNEIFLATNRRANKKFSDKGMIDIEEVETIDD